MSKPLEIHKYSITKLKQLLAQKAKTSLPVINAKLHCVYFEHYFNYIGAKTIIVENGYIDKDYLEDFIAFYVRCYDRYERNCTRLHFFSKNFSKKEFEAFIGGTPSKLTIKKLQENYLGFIVVKPLARTIIGRTCLKAYDDDNGRRHYLSNREYDVNLFGIPLKAENTLAFQEQDTVAAACATSALWTAFQATGKLFHHPILSPVEITKAASINLSDPTSETRVLPNAGLNIAQMVSAIRNVGLESLLVRVGHEHNLEIEKNNLKSTVYAYLRAGIPAILGFLLIDNAEKQIIGKHAVAITGFSTPKRKGKSNYPELGDFRLKSSLIDKFYAHDDQVGPFSRLTFDEETGLLKNSWGYKVYGDDDTIVALPLILLIPLYHKIRIPFNSIRSTIVHFDFFINQLRSESLFPAENKLEWDIFLSTNSKVKQDLFEDKLLTPHVRRAILLDGMPRYVWRAIARVNGMPYIELLFDATDTWQGKFFIRAIEYDVPFYAFLKIIAKNPVIINLINSDQSIENMGVIRIFEWLNEQE